MARTTQRRINKSDPAAYEEMLRELAINNWDREVTHFEHLSEFPLPDPSDKNFLKAATFRANAIKAQAGVLQSYARAMAGTIVRGSTTKDKKAVETDILRAVRERLKNRGILPESGLDPIPE